MPVITPYDQRVLPNAQIGVRASGADFGSQVGAAIEGVGKGVAAVGDALYQHEVQQDTTKMYKDLAVARAQFTSDLRNELLNAQPGDTTFVARMDKNVNDYLEKLQDSYTTRAGQEQFARESAQLSGHFRERAMAAQADLAAAGARQDNVTTLQNNSNAVFNDPTQLEDTLRVSKQMIYDPNSIYKYLPVPEKDKLWQETSTQLRYAAQLRQIKDRPEEFLAKVSPEELAKFRGTSQSIGGLQTSAPRTTNEKMDTLTPAYNKAAETYNVDPNILKAQGYAESGGNTNAASPKGARGVAQFMPATAARYNVDVNDDNSSINGQAHYMSDLLKMFGGDYKKALAGYNWGEKNVQNAIDTYGELWMQHAPTETKNYVGKVLANVNALSTTGQPVMADQPAAKIGDPAFDALPFEMQYKMVQMAETQVRSNEVKEQKQYADAERFRKQQQEATEQSWLKSYANHELTPDMITSAQGVDATMKMTYLRAVATQANKMDNTDPTVFNQVFDMVHKGQITDPQQLFDWVGHGVSLEDTKKLQDIVKGKGTPVIEQQKDFLKQLNMVIAKPNAFGIADPDGAVRAYNAQSEFFTAYNDGLKKGVTPTEMLTPPSTPGFEHNKHYLGYIIEKWNRPGMERISAITDAINAGSQMSATAAQPRLAGETPELYLQRTGGK